jgi:putative polyhydroxyalkanoate system protein
MADVRVVRRHALPMPEARALAERALAELAERYGADTEWRGDVLRFRAPGAQGEVRLSPSEIRVDMKLGLLLRPMKAKLTERVARRLDRLLRPPQRARRATTQRRT